MNYNTILPPFKWFVLQNFPYIEDDFDALTNWQLFCKLGKEMNKIIEKCNLTGEQVENLTNAFNALKAYVDDYFENLDVQEEINNKLDEMAEQGVLTDIIAQYLQLAGVLAYDNKQAMKQAQNLADGSIAKTLGNTTYKDGQGAFFKVRQIQNTDIVDDENIIALYDPDLVAEKIPSESTYFNSKFAQNIIKNIPSTIVFAGDSLTYGQNTSGGRVDKPFSQLIQEFVNRWYNNNNLITCVNEGVQGARSTQALEDFENYKLENPSTIFWSYGTNDATDGITMDDYIENLDKFYKLCKTNNIELIVIIPPPSYQTLYRRQSMKIMEDSLIQYCIANDLLYIDMFEYVENLYNIHRYRNYSDLQTDGTHFTNYYCYYNAIVSKLLPCVFVKDKSQNDVYVDVSKTRNYVKTTGYELPTIEVSSMYSGIKLLPDYDQFEFNFAVEDDCYVDLLGYRINTGCKANFTIDGQAFTIDEEYAENTNNQDFQYNWQFTIPYHITGGMHTLKLESLTTHDSSVNFYLFGFMIRKNQETTVNILYPQRKNMIQLWNGNSTSITVPFPSNMQNLNNYCNEINLLLGYADGFTNITINPVDIYRNFYENHTEKFVVHNAGSTGFETATFTIDITNHRFVFSSPSLPLRRINMIVNRDHLQWHPNTNTQWFPNS